MSKPTKNIICMKWGTRYGPEYTNRLFNMVSRNMAGELGKDYRFVCITDDAKGLDERIETKPLPPLNAQLPTHLKNKPWLKLLVWDDPLFDLTGDALFLDVDVVITGSLDDFFTYQPEADFIPIYNWTEPGKNIGNTSVFRFKIGKNPQILHDFIQDMQGIYDKYRIEQRYISKVLPNIIFWPTEWCRSFKEELIPPLPLRWFIAPKLPKDARIIIFHGKPDPDEAAAGVWPTKPGQWYKKIYKTLRPTRWITENWH